MALEAVVFPKEHLSCTAMHAPPLGYVDAGKLEDSRGVASQEEVGAYVEDWWDVTPPERVEAAASAGTRRRRRTKAVKDKEVAESQRRNHIAVERNRRRQMNEYLAVLRSVMPPSHAQRGDQASIVGGAINFVKELEQLLQSLQAQKRRADGSDLPPPFAGFFTFPLYSTSVAAAGDTAASGNESGAGARPGMADIEVTVAESHANVKVLAPRRPRQLLRMVVGLQCLGLTVLHLNVTTTPDQMAFYSFSLKMENECRLTTVGGIAAAVHRMVASIAEECVG